MKQKSDFVHHLKMQRDQLEQLIRQFEHKPHLNEIDSHVYDIMTKQVEKNLRLLRKAAGEKAFQNLKYKYQD